MRSVTRRLWIASAVLLAGCRGVEEREEITDEHFFPPAPVPARIQYLRTFSGSADVIERSALLEFVAGAGDVSEYTIVKPFSVATWKRRMYVTDSFGLRGLNVFDLENGSFYVLGKKPGGGHLIKPIHIFVDHEGFKYISDLYRKRVIVYGPDDNYVRNHGDGSSFTPVCCAVYGDEIFILDMRKDPVEFRRDGETVLRDVRRDQILVLDKKTGEPLRRIGQHALPEEGFAWASFLGVDRLGNLYVSDFLHHRVVKLDREGNVYLEFGRHGDAPGAFPKPKGIAVDRRGLIYVADAEFHVVQVFDNAGQMLFFFGESTAAKGRMTLPAGIWIDYDNVDLFRDYYGPDFEPEYLILVANQVGESPGVAVYAYGKRRSHEYPLEDNIVTLDKTSVEPLWKMPVFPPDVYRAPAIESQETQLEGIE